MAAVCEQGVRRGQGGGQELAWGGICIRHPLQQNRSVPHPPHTYRLKTTFVILVSVGQGSGCSSAGPSIYLGVPRRLSSGYHPKAPPGKDLPPSSLLAGFSP